MRRNPSAPPRLARNKNEVSSLNGPEPLQVIVLNSGAQKFPYSRVRSIEPAKNHFTFKL